MNKSGQGMMIILSSPSGAGKTTLTRLLSKKNKNLEISISHTTRVPRENEIEGRDYYFTNKKDFKKLIDKDSFFEYATVFNNYYGTSKKLQ
jgi:guanylate kinase